MAKNRPADQAVHKKIRKTSSNSGRTQHGKPSRPGEYKKTMCSTKKRKSSGNSVEELIQTSMKTLKRMGISATPQDSPAAAAAAATASLPSTHVPRSKPVVPGVVCIPLSDSDDEPMQPVTERAGRQRASEKKSALVKKRKRQHAVHAIGITPAALQRPQINHEGVADGGAECWWLRCRRVLLNCLEEHAYSVIARSVVSWPVSEVHRLCKDWEPSDVAAVFNSDTATPERIAGLMSPFDAKYVAKCCESWSPEELHDILPRLKVKKVRQVLELLYFKSQDPYLSTPECKQLLLAFSERRRGKVCRKLDPDMVDHVMRNRGEETDSDEGSEGGVEGDDSYESSFIDDEEGDEEDD